MALIQAEIVIALTGLLRLLEFVAVTDSKLAALKDSAAGPSLPGVTHVGVFNRVPVLLFPDQSAVVLPVFSSNFQWATRSFTGVALTCVESALPPKLFAAETT